MDTGCFLSASFAKISDSGKYRASYHLKNQENLDLYLKEYAPKLRIEFTDMFQSTEIETTRNTFECLYLKHSS
jgi:hypothetical protein